MNSKVILLEHPSEKDWMEVRFRALVTVGKASFKFPTFEWRQRILSARHSPIRYLRFSFYITCPYWVSVHLTRHIHAQPYIRSQRNDRQQDYDRNAARQDEMVSMIWDMNAEELITIANKRLCNKAAAETQEVVFQMCNLVWNSNPEFRHELAPMCIREHRCNEMQPCERSITIPGGDSNE